MAGDEVLMVFHRVSAAISRNLTQPVPAKKLVEFDRVAVPGDGTCAAITFMLYPEAMSLTSADGDRVVYPGIHYFDVANGVGLNATFSVTWKDEAMTLPR